VDAGSSSNSSSCSSTTTRGSSSIIVAPTIPVNTISTFCSSFKILGGRKKGAVTTIYGINI